MVAWRAGGQLRHTEVELINNGDTPRRFAEYFLWFHRSFDEHVELTLLYSGMKPCTMPNVFETEAMKFTYRILEARRLDGEALTGSEVWAENILAMLPPADKARVVEAVARSIGKLEGDEERTVRVTFRCIQT